MNVLRICAQSYPYYETDIKDLTLASKLLNHSKKDE